MISAGVESTTSRAFAGMRRPAGRPQRPTAARRHAARARHHAFSLPTPRMSARLMLHAGQHDGLDKRIRVDDELDASRHARHAVMMPTEGASIFTF